MSKRETIPWKRLPRTKRSSRLSTFSRTDLNFASNGGFRTARLAFLIVYSFLFLFGETLHFHAQMGCDSCPSGNIAVFRTWDGTPTVARDDFCDECRHRDDFCPACHFFSVFRFFTVVAFAFLAIVCLKDRLWNDGRRVVSLRRVFQRQSRAPPCAVVL